MTNIVFAPALVSAVQVSRWGSELVLSCLDDPLTRRRFEVVFRECREIRWSPYDTTPADEAEADVIGFCAGQPDHAEPAVLTTDLFELSVRYGRRVVRERSLNPA